MHSLTEADLEQSVPDRFYAVVAEHGRRTAIQTNEGPITYDQLNRDSNRIAHALLEKLGSGEEAVCLLFEHGASAVSAIMGTLKAGKIYVPLNASVPAARNAQILAHSEARVLLTNTMNLDTADLLAESARRLDLINIDTLAEHLHEANPDLIISPDNGSYLIYTSGTTGTPKGILNNHRNILHSSLIEAGTTKLSPEDRVALLYNYNYGASRAATFASLTMGAALHPYDIRREGLHNLFQWLADHQITLLSTLPTVFRRLVEQAESQPPLPHLRHVSLGGEAVTRRDVELFRAIFPGGCTLTNRFASTETGRLTEFPIDHSTPIETSVAPIGYPLNGKKITITDADGNPMEVGVEGEITIQSRFLARGYWRDPELTTRAFQPAPDGSGERIYKTGDLGLMRPDGCLIYLGRRDSQVKIRGQRVEIAEVEVALLEQPNVREVAVVARPDGEEEVRLVAYVVPRAGYSVESDRLIAALSKHLSAYMVPSVILPLDELPVTATGKVDARRLPLPEMQERQVNHTYVAPMGTVERRLVRIWEETLQVTPIGTEDKFLALGGNSLAALQIFRRIEVELGKKLPLNVMFEAETIKDLVREIKREDIPPPWPSLIPLQPNGTRPPLYIVPGVGGQVILYNLFAKKLGADQPVYGLRAQGHDGVTPPYTSIEDMAAHYAREIRAFQPEGPYYLSGFSLGGKIAFELARQLQEEGAQVALVAIVDTFVTPFLEGFGRNVVVTEHDEDQAAIGKRVSKHWREIRQRPPRAAIGYIGRLIGRLWYWQVLKRLDRLRSGPRRIDAPAISPERRIKIATYTAGQRYKFKPYNGNLVVFRTEDMQMRRADPLPVWQEWVTGSVDLIDIPGDHESMLRDPDVNVLADNMTALLMSIQSQNAVTSS